LSQRIWSFLQLVADIPGTCTNTCCNERNPFFVLGHTSIWFWKHVSLLYVFPQSHCWSSGR
jgi:hypothetical protein